MRRSDRRSRERSRRNKRGPENKLAIRRVFRGENAPLCLGSRALPFRTNRSPEVGGAPLAVRVPDLMGGVDLGGPIWGHRAPWRCVRFVLSLKVYGQGCG